MKSLLNVVRNIYDGNELRNGDKIQITWLPSNMGVKNCYIGSKGVVENLNDEGFNLRFASGAGLVITNNFYTFKKIK